MEVKLQQRSPAQQGAAALYSAPGPAVQPSSQKRAQGGHSPAQQKNKHTQSHAHSVAFAVKGYRGFVMLTWCLFTGMSSRWELHVRTRTGHTHRSDHVHRSAIAVQGETQATQGPVKRLCFSLRTGSSLGCGHLPRYPARPTLHLVARPDSG